MFEELGAFNRQMIACYLAGLSFSHCALLSEALGVYSKIFEIYERTKVGNYSALALGYVFSSQIIENLGDLEKALYYSLKALEMSNKTDSLVARGAVFCNLTVQYSRRGDLKHAEESFDKLMKLPPEIRSHFFVHEALARAVLFAVKNQWKESNQYFAKTLELGSESYGGIHFINPLTKSLFAWTLERQGRFEDARLEVDEVQKICQEAKEKFEHANLHVRLIAPARIKVNQIFEMRLDIVNVSRSHGRIVRIENIINPKMETVNLPQGFEVRNFGIDLDKEELNPFQVVTVKLILRAKQAGRINLSPKVVYISDLEETVISDANKVFITLEPDAASVGESRIVELQRIEFKSNSAESAFDYLTKAFLEDYEKQRLPLEKSGWRTLMEVVRSGKVSKHSMYGKSGRGGQAIVELRRLGLIESRFFLGERGRTGRVLKVRVFIENERLKQLLDQKNRQVRDSRP